MTNKPSSPHVTWAESVSQYNKNSANSRNQEDEEDNSDDHENFGCDQQNDDELSCSNSSSSLRDDDEEDEEKDEDSSSFSSSSSSASTSSSRNSEEDHESSLSSNSANSWNDNDSTYSSAADGQGLKQQRPSNLRRPSLGLPLFTIRNRKQLSIIQKRDTPLGDDNHDGIKNGSPTSMSSPAIKKSSRKKTKNNSSVDAIPSIKSLYMKSFQIMISSCSKRSTILFISSLFFWIFIQYHVSRSSSTSRYNAFEEPTDRNADLQQKILQLRKQREQSALKSLGSAAGALFKRKKKPSSGEEYAKEDRLPKGCSPQPWQNGNHPTCNDVQSLDLREVLNMQRRGMKIPANLGDGDKSFDPWNREDKVKSMRMGYLGSGLWRQVWRVQPRLRTEDAVLKVMKSEHPVNPRNFDRHRRDALVMDVLKGSDRIVDVYGFCGNTVLTEYAGITLDDFLFEGWHEVAPYSERYDLRREDGLGKVELALDVMRGLNALHERGIIHADLQAKQMLLDPVLGVKVNDFNRCRLQPIHDKTGELCKLKIPSAPGAFRSPEEYELQKIDTKADIFSAANILYGVVTGKQPWGDEFMTIDIQKRIIKGNKPEIDEKYLRPGTVEAALSQVVLKAYEFNPRDRLSAEQLIQELEKIKNDIIG